MKYGLVNELMMTVGFPRSGGCGRVGKRSGHALGARSGRPDLGGREGLGGRRRGRRTLRRKGEVGTRD